MAPIDIGTRRTMGIQLLTKLLYCFAMELICERTRKVDESLMCRHSCCITYMKRNRRWCLIIQRSHKQPDSKACFAGVRSREGKEEGILVQTLSPPPTLPASSLPCTPSSPSHCKATMENTGATSFCPTQVAGEQEHPQERQKPPRWYKGRNIQMLNEGAHGAPWI